MIEFNAEGIRSLVEERPDLFRTDAGDTPECPECGLPMLGRKTEDGPFCVRWHASTAGFHDLADRMLPGDYTVERVEFTDGDTRTRAKHTVGWSSTMYVTHTLWRNGDYWLDYYENDRRVARRRYSWKLGERAV